MIFIIVLILIFFQLINAEWNLVWNDDFDSDLDHFYNTWNVVDQNDHCGM